MSVEISITDQIVEINEVSNPVEISVVAGAAIIPTWGGITGTLSNQTDLQNALNSKVPYSGATANVDLGEFELKAGQIEYDQTPTGVAGVAVTRWNDSTGTIETTLKGGSVVLEHGRDMFERVVNKTGIQLTKAAYQAVRVSNAQGQRLAVQLAQANNDNNSADTIGLVVETIDNNQEGYIYTVGEIDGVNTTGTLQGETWVDGDVLYLSPTTAGRITNVKPVAPQHLVIIGYVVYAHQNNGKIYTKITNGFELGELHDVDTTGAVAGNVLKYNGTIWTPSGDVGITSLNGLTATTQIFATGTSGTDFNISSATSTHTFNLPSASAANRGLLTSADWTTFNNKQNALTNPVTGTGVSGQVSYWSGTNTQTGSNNLFWDATNNRLGIGTNAPNNPLQIGASPAASLQVPLASIVSTYNSPAGTGNSIQNTFIIAGSDPTSRGILSTIRTRGTISTPTAVLTGDISLALIGGLFDGTNSQGSAAIQFEAESNASAGSAPQLIRFDTGLTGAGRTTKMQLRSNGNLILQNGGTFTDNGERLQVIGTTLLNGNVTFSSATGMFWDATNNRLGIGTNVPANPIDVIGSSFAEICSTISSDTGNAGALLARKSRGTIASPTALQSADRLGALLFSGHNGTSFVNPVAVIGFAAETFTTSANGGFLTFQTTSSGSTTRTEKLRIFGSGNVLIQNGGTFTDSGQRLQVTGDTLLKGSGNTSATTALTVQNSAGTNMWRFLNDGDLLIGTSGVVTIRPNNGTITSPQISGLGITLNMALQGTGSGVIINNNNGDRVATSGVSNTFLVQNGFAPTSGTGTFSMIVGQGTINQTGGANGITRGLYVNPTLTAAADWRSIEWSNNTGWGLYGAGTSNNFLNGSLLIGSTSLTTRVTLRLGKNITGGGTSYGILNDGQVQSDVNVIAFNYDSQSNTASAFTLSDYVHYRAAQATLNGTVTTQTGFLAHSSLTGATNNYGFYGNIASGTGRWNLYMNGTADNYLAGSLGIGSTSLTGYNLRINKNITGGTVAVSVENSSVIQSDVTSIGVGFSSLLGTQAASFTLNSIRHFLAQQSTIGASSTVNNQSGFHVNNTLIGATNNYGFYGDIASGSGRWNFYANGSALNYFNGNTIMGTLAADSGEKLQVNGTMKVTGASTFGGNVTLLDADNIIIGTTTGTKLGTATSQKIGFWNATPIVQPTTAVASATRVGGAGNTVTDTDTYDGYTLPQIVKALRNAGLLA